MRSERRGRSGQGSIVRAGRVGKWREMSCSQIQFGLDFALLTLQSSIKGNLVKSISQITERGENVPQTTGER